VWAEEITTYYALKVVGRLMALVNERAIKVAESLQVEHHDLIPLLECSLRTYSDFLHFIPEGAAAIAQALAAHILRQPMRSRQALVVPVNSTVAVE
jgi:hypothetical protein